LSILGAGVDCNLRGRHTVTRGRLGLFLTARLRWPADHRASPLLRRASPIALRPQPPDAIRLRPVLHRLPVSRSSRSSRLSPPLHSKFLPSDAFHAPSIASSHPSSAVNRSVLVVRRETGAVPLHVELISWKFSQRSNRGYAGARSSQSAASRSVPAPVLRPPSRLA